MDETRVIDPVTGGQKGSKLARFSLIPGEFVWALAEHYGKGAKKYADRNWEKGYKWSLTIDALERHLNAVKMGEWLDLETGSAHIIAVAWHACALFIFHLRGIGTNNIHRNFPDYTPHDPPEPALPSAGFQYYRPNHDGTVTHVSRNNEIIATYSSVAALAEEWDDD